MLRGLQILFACQIKHFQACIMSMTLKLQMSLANYKKKNVNYNKKKTVFKSNLVIQLKLSQVFIRSLKNSSTG